MPCYQIYNMAERKTRHGDKTKENIGCRIWDIIGIIVLPGVASPFFTNLESAA